MPISQGCRSAKHTTRLSIKCCYHKSRLRTYSSTWIDVSWSTQTLIQGMHRRVLTLFVFVSAGLEDGDMTYNEHTFGIRAKPRLINWEKREWTISWMWKCMWAVWWYSSNGTWNPYEKSVVNSCVCLIILLFSFYTNEAKPAIARIVNGPGVRNPAT